MSETAAAPSQTSETSSAAPAPAADAAAPADANQSAAAQSDAGTIIAPGAEAQPDAKADTAVEGPVVPEQYEIKAPDGETYDPASIEAFTPIAKEAKLTNEQAEAVYRYGSKAVREAVEAATAGVLATQAEKEAGWLSDLKADPKIMSGEKLTEDASVAASAAIDRFGGDDLRKALNDTRAGNHPAIVRALIDIGKALQGAGPLVTGTPPQGPRGNTLGEIAQRIYANKG